MYYGAVGKTRRYLAFQLPIAVEDDRVVLVDVDPARAGSLCSWAAAHQRPKIAPSRSGSMVAAPCRRKVIRDLFRVCVKGATWPIRDVNGTRGVDSQKAVPVIHKDAFPDPLPSMQLRPP